LFIVSAGFVYLMGMEEAYAQTYTSPHGGYSGSTHFCTLCHEMHEAPGNRLLKDMPESTLCFTCHNGTGSVYNIQVQMDADPATFAMHPIKVSLPNNPGTYNYTPVTTAGLAPPGPYDCSQCHNPHGDTGNGMLLRGSYDTGEYVVYATSPDPYGACWSCHSSAMVQDTALFHHQSHVITNQASCSACHYSPHAAAHIELVNFNPLFVGPSLSQGTGPAYVDNGDHSGSCTLTCHGVDHNPYSY
jgi:predicted CXXCH cytochrome family protein